VFKENDRLGLTPAGYKTLNEKYWLDQAYEVVNIGLRKILNHNNAISSSHQRINHKIKQKVVGILASGLTNNLSGKNNSTYLY